jgi:3-methyladenine DNA glycosylase AlkD
MGATGFRQRTSRATPGVASKRSADDVVRWLQAQGSQRTRDGMARYGLPSDKAFGVPVGVLQREAKKIGRDHQLAAELWDTGWYEARMMTAMVGDPLVLSPSQMDRWCRDFDSWGICDTLCFHLFDKSPHAWGRVRAWAKRKAEFEKRAAFALLASLALHDKAAPDSSFLDALPLVESGAADDRNFVKKGVSWALRLIGRRSPELHAESVALARRLRESSDAGARWIGRDALRELTSPAVLRKLEQRRTPTRAARPRS